MKVMHITSLSVLLLASSMYAHADEREIIDTYIGRELYVETGFAGASVTIGKDEGNYLICHKVFGSGIPIISSTVYPASKQSDWQLRFRIKEDNNFILSVSAPGELKLSLNGYALQKPKISSIRNDDFCSEN